MSYWYQKVRGILEVNTEGDPNEYIEEKVWTTKLSFMLKAVQLSTWFATLHGIPWHQICQVRRQSTGSWSGNAGFRLLSTSPMMEMLATTGFSGLCNILRVTRPCVKAFPLTCVRRFTVRFMRLLLKSPTTTAFLASSMRLANTAGLELKKLNLYGFKFDENGMLIVNTV